MQKKKFDFEISPSNVQKEAPSIGDGSINEKYEKGYSRVVTENGSYKIALIRDTFSQNNYNLHPEYQRRINWNTKKRSKLIESLIINIPIPPIFMYEYDYDKYEIMDGLQRISAIMDFYNNRYKLTGLEEWSELNGKRYIDLPEKIKEGIDRRQIQVISLLKESAGSSDRADKIKRLVFERLNTGGVKLQGQEIRNAIYNGKGNLLCIDLSENSFFRILWNIPNVPDDDSEAEDYDPQEIDAIEDEKIKQKLERHFLYKRMYDVELVLRFFAMRFVEDFNCQLSDFLDSTLITLNKYSDEQLNELRSLFEKTISKANSFFGEFAFCFFDGKKWSTPTKMVFDPIMQVLSQEDINPIPGKKLENVAALEQFFIENSTEQYSLFDGKHQSKDDIQKRMEKLDSFIRTLL